MNTDNKFHKSEWETIKNALQWQMMSSTSESLDAKIAMILVEIEGILSFWDKPRGKCKYCGQTFTDLDMKVEQSRPKDVCSSCFTSNA